MKCKIFTPDLGWKKASVVKEFIQEGGQHHGETMIVLKLNDRSLSLWERERISLKKDVIFEKKCSFKEI